MTAVFCCQTALVAGGELVDRNGIEARYLSGREDIRVRFFNAPGYSNDWICIAGKQAGYGKPEISSIPASSQV